MKWVVIGIFLVGLILVALGVLGQRSDERARQSADVMMGDAFVRAIGYGIWVFALVVFVLWKLFT